MMGFKPRMSGACRDRSTHCATATSILRKLIVGAGVERAIRLVVVFAQGRGANLGVCLPTLVG